MVMHISPITILYMLRFIFKNTITKQLISILMKKINFLLAAFLLLAGFSSCQKEPQGGENNPQTGGKTLVTATIEALKSGADAEVTNDFWATGDKLKVV